MKQTTGERKPNTQPLTRAKRAAAALLLLAPAGSELAACDRKPKQTIPLCGIAIVNHEQPKQVPPITIKPNQDGSYGPKIPPDVLQRVKDATVKIRYGDERNGSGVIVNGRIVTAAHVISGLDIDKITVTRANGTEIPLSQNPYHHCVEYIVDGKRTAPLDNHGNSTLDAAVLTPVDKVEGLSFGKGARDWVIYGGYAGREEAEHATGLQLITGSDATFPNGRTLTNINGGPTEPGDSGGPLTNFNAECTGIVVGVETSTKDKAALSKNYGVNAPEAQYQVTHTVISEDLIPMVAVLEAGLASPR